MDQIRVDQSHCNYHLSQWLSLRRWEVLFTDAGRVSRGGSGTQGIILKIFEEHRLPIPDVVAVSGSQLLIVEIDSVFTKAQNSLEIYRKQGALILDLMNARLGREHPLDSLELGFCRTGVIHDPAKFFSGVPALSTDIDSWIVFTAPEKPACFWAKRGYVEK